MQQTAQIRAKLLSGRRPDRLQRDVLFALDKALEAADPSNILQSHVKLRQGILLVDRLAYPLKRYGRIFVIGAGKASGLMGEEIERILGSKVTAGLVLVPAHLRPFPKGRRIKYHRASHPIPSKRNIQGVDRMLKMIAKVGERDLVIVLISGGASALMDYPLEGIGLIDEKKTTELLLKSGARIQEVNSVRKHISRIKGGRLAQILSQGHVLTLIISDVVGDEVEVIGSGPTAPDPTTYKDAKLILEKYQLWLKIPARVRKVIERGIEERLPETPKPRDKIFRSVKNVVLANNRESCRAAASAMRRRGYVATILSTRITGEAREVGRILGSLLSDIRINGIPVSPPAALVSGGETTVTIAGSGKGGRNQELALSAALAIEDLSRVVIASIGTDGVDGPTDAAGAIVDGATVTRGVKLRMDPNEYLRNNDSYSYLSRTMDLIKTGPTGTNVNDVMIIAAG